MTSPALKLAGRIAVAAILIMLAAGSVFAAAATLPAAQAPVVVEPAETNSPEAKESPKPERSPKGDEAKDQDADESTNAGRVEQAEQVEQADSAPSAANLDRIVKRLAAAGIVTTANDLAALAAKVGVGGAVRVLRFAKASGKTTAEILAMFESGKGWGMIARELKLDIGPGNGSVVGKGHGQDEASKAADRAARAKAKAARAATHAARAAERAQQKATSEG